MISTKLLQKTFFKITIPCASVKSVRYPTPYVHPNPLNQPIPTKKHFMKKHWNHKFRKERAAKVAKVELPDFHEKSSEDMTPSEIKAKLKKFGIQPFRHWDERPIYLSSTGDSFDPYIPPEGDGRAPLMSSDGVKQSMSLITKKGASLLALRDIKKYEDEFTLQSFSEKAQDIYINLHKAITNYDEDAVHQYATEKAFPLVLHETKNKTIRWSFIKSLEPPRVVHLRCTHLVEKDNKMAQITVRFNTQQTLAVYDRFGRLIHGSEVIARDVLEYVVFEKNITNLYGLWRVHDKIIPKWMNVTPISMLTFKKKKETEKKSEETKDVENVKKEETSVAN